MDRIAAMVKLLGRPDVVEQHLRLAEQRHAKAKAANDIYKQRHGCSKRSSDSRNHVSRYPDMVLHHQHRRQPCERCGSKVRLEVCHIIPVEAGRDDSPSNIIWLCHDCHVLLHNVQEDWTLEAIWAS